MNRVLHPLASGQVEQVESILEEFDPDIVCLGVSHYAFTMLTVKSKVTRRWGKRGLNVAKRVEKTFDRLTPGNGLGKRANRAGRALAKTVVGTAPVSTYDEVVSAYVAVMKRLSRREDIQVVVMGGARLSGTIQTTRIGSLIARFQTDMMAATADRRFVWFDTEATLAGPDRESYFLRDGIHRNLKGHRRVADMLLPVLATAINGARAPG